MLKRLEVLQNDVSENPKHAFNNVKKNEEEGIRPSTIAYVYNSQLCINARRKSI